MAATGDLWWMTPLQAIAALSAGVSSGASGLQPVLVFPALEDPGVSALATGIVLRNNLNRSERLFPRLNAVSEVLHLALAIVSFLKRKESRAAGVKWPFLAAAFACNFATTAWSIGIQVPINNRMKEQVVKLEADASDGKSMSMLSDLLRKWKPLALVRASFLLTASILGGYTLFLDGKYS